MKNEDIIGVMASKPYKVYFNSNGTNTITISPSMKVVAGDLYHQVRMLNGNIVLVPEENVEMIHDI